MARSPHAADRDLDVSVVLPIYNEAGHLRAEIERIRAAMDDSAYRYEIITVDDGSTDGSGQELAQIDGIKIIRFPVNSGVGAARRAGTAAARGKVVVWTDCDMTYPNDEIPRLVKELDGFDQVVGARSSEQGTVRFLRAPAKWLIRRLASYLVRVPISDLNSGFRAFRRDVAMQFLHLLPRGFSCVTTMTMSFLAGGYVVKYVPIEYAPRAGRSKFHWYRDTVNYVTQVVRLVLSYEPLRVFMPAGLSLAVLGIAKLSWDWVAYDLRLTTNTLLILFAAFQLLAIGFLADLVVRLNRPKAVVERATL